MQLMVSKQSTPAEPIQNESLLHGPIEPVKAWFFETIDGMGAELYPRSFESGH